MFKGLTTPAVPPRPLAVTFVLTVGFAATFCLPYFFPVSPSISDSFVVGFNNRVSVSVFLLFLAAFSWWVRDFGLMAREAPQAPERPSRPLLGLVLVIFLTLSLGEWLLMLHHPVIQEAIYFLDRLRHLAAGEVPYRDFEFTYGPLLLYLPLAVARLTGVTITTAYFCTWILQYLLGGVFIYLCLVPFPATRRQKNLIFLLLASPWWAGAFNLGPNYTPFRFFLGPLLAIEMAPRLNSTLSSVRVVAEVFLCGSLLLLVSPEQATAFLGATLLFLALSGLLSHSSVLFARLGAVFVGSALLLLSLYRLGLFDTAAAMSRGGYNFPLLPTPVQVPLFILILVSAASLASATFGRRPLGASEMLVLLGLFLLPAAFGRADPGHFLINTVPLTLSGLLLLTQHPRALRAISITYVVCVLLVPAPAFLKVTLPAQRAAMRTTPSPAQPLGGVIPFAPFTYPSATSAATPSFMAQTGFFDGVQNVTTPEQVDRVVAELGIRHPAQLLLPDHFSCAFTYNAHYLHRALYTPLVPPPRRKVSYVLQPLCNYINATYFLAPGFPAPRGYHIWAKKP